MKFFHETTEGGLLRPGINYVPNVKINLEGSNLSKYDKVLYVCIYLPNKKRTTAVLWRSFFKYKFPYFIKKYVFGVLYIERKKVG